MKKLVLLIAAIGLCALAPQAYSADTPAYAFQSVTVPATIPATTISNLASAPTMTVTKQSLVPIYINFQQATDSASNCVFRFHKSLDGTHWDTNTFLDVTIAANRTKAAIVVTNVGTWTGGAGYVQLYSIANTPSITVMTNISVGYAVRVLGD